MAKLAVIKTGGKQYLVKEGDEIYVDRIEGKKNDQIKLETLAIFEEEKEVAIGQPRLQTQTEAVIIEQAKGEKIRVARFKAKVRYRKVKGFRPQLTKIKINKL
ncbi:MAG: 50S ribosomal protein L21 [Microgenomates group bacterium]|nr:50S ribosomal protein L21 [Microgenomates group bacterium]